MEPIVSFYESQSVDFWLMLKTYGIILSCILVAGLIGRFLFGKKSRINHAVTSAISIVFIYALAATIRTIGSDLNWLIAPLPFTYISGNNLAFLAFEGTASQIICEEILCMIVLSFLVNLADYWIPAGKNAFSWLMLRIATALIGWGGYLLVDWLCNAYLPIAILVYAPSILLALLVIMILVGALKLLVGVLLAAVNPVIGALYTFFFANVVGRQITKALFTTALLAGLVMLLRSLGVVSLSLGVGALVAYLPFIVLLLVLWYGIRRKH